MTATPSPRAIFRPEAVRRYGHGVEQAVLPRFVSPRTAAWLWVLLCLLVAALALAWMTPAPLYASGIATVAPWHAPALRSSAPILLVFLPADALPRLHGGQRLLLTDDAGATIDAGKIGLVLRDVLGPADAQRAFNLGAGAARRLTGPSAVAIALHAPVTYVGSVYRATVVLGTHSALSLLPVVGR
jgi:hypothetical protein